MMKNFEVELIKKVDDSYDIAIGRNFFSTLIKDIKQGLFPKANRIAIITDSNVSALYAKKFYKQLQTENIPQKVYFYEIEAGEQSKTRETKAHLEDKMLANSFGRDSAIIAIGGGVVTDLAGFVAGTFGRGIPFVNYATTLLAAADASIGGKTAVDTPVATNLIGVFHQPKKVYIDLATWETLPPKEISAGLAETIKHACLADKYFFIYLEENIAKIIVDNKPVLETSAIEHIAYKNCQIKYNIVRQDEREANLRQILNLGHTLGRAMETLCQYRYIHGECVAIGLAFQAFLGMQRGLVSDQEFNRLVNLLKKAGLPTSLPDEFSDEEIVAKMHTDKKVRKGDIYFVLQQSIGSMYSENGNYGIKYSDQELISAVKNYRLLG